MVSYNWEADIEKVKTKKSKSLGKNVFQFPHLTLFSHILFPFDKQNGKLSLAAIK